MTNAIKNLFIILVAACLLSCGKDDDAGPSKLMFVIDGKAIEVNEDEVTCFKCTLKPNGTSIWTAAYFNKDKTGFIHIEGVGGTYTNYGKEGLNHRWDYGLDSEGNYRQAFIVLPDRTGLFYDFSNAEPGESVSPTEEFNCE
ncbi:MAG: hypothetical protein OXH57_11965 [Ekhidna sp.]|nr:hypothetical protein [Ekhidna sp.]